MRQGDHRPVPKLFQHPPQLSLSRTTEAGVGAGSQFGRRTRVQLGGNFVVKLFGAIGGSGTTKAIDGRCGRGGSITVSVWLPENRGGTSPSLSAKGRDSEWAGDRRT